MNKCKSALLSLLLGSVFITGTVSADEDSRLMEQDKVNAQQAITIAQERSGLIARAIKREARSRNRIYWEVDLVDAKGSEREIYVDTRTGQILRERSEFFTSRDDKYENRSLYSGVTNGGFLTLSEAITQGESRVGGKTFKASFDSDGGKDHWDWDFDFDFDWDDDWDDGPAYHFYDVETVSGYHHREVYIPAEKNN